MNTKKNVSWNRIILCSLAVSAAGFVASFFWQAHAIGLLAALFFFGAVAGWLAQGHGWLCGLIVGLPLSLTQMTRLALQSQGSLPDVLWQPDYWRLLVPACVISTGMAVMGGIVGVWMQGVKWERNT
jgi:hypothetical protein